MKKNSITIITLIIIIVLLGFQLIISNRLATIGEKLSSIQQETEKLKNENELLEQKIASSSSLLFISKRAEELGFQKANIRYLSQPPVAYRQK